MGMTFTGRLRRYQDGCWVAECLELGCRAIGRDRTEALQRLRELVEYEMAEDLSEAEGAMRPDDLVPFEVDLPPEKEEGLD